MVIRIAPPYDSFLDGFDKAFARLILEFGRLEYLVKLCIKDLHGRGFTAGMLKAEQSPRQFRALCNDAKREGSNKLTADEASAFEEMIDSALELADYRNDTVHAYWTMEDNAPMRIRPLFNRKTKDVDWSRARSVSVEELSSKCGAIRRLREHLNRSRLVWSVRASKESAWL